MGNRRRHASQLVIAAFLATTTVAFGAPPEPGVAAAPQTIVTIE
jgi:hypothetical protein